MTARGCRRAETAMSAGTTMPAMAGPVLGSCPGITVVMAVCTMASHSPLPKAAA